MQQGLFEIRDLRHKEKFFIDDYYLNGYAKLCGVYATAVYNSLARHADKNQKCFPSYRKIAEQHNISERQVYRAIKILEKHGIIKRERLGKKLNNRYYLLDRSEWTHSHITPDSQSHHPLTHSHIHSKDTHTKDTHSKDIPKGIQQAEYGNPDINEVYNFLKSKLGGTPDGSIKENRRFAKLLIDRFKKDYSAHKPVKLIKVLIEAGLQDDFHGKNITSFKYLYYHGQKIIQGRLSQKSMVAPAYNKNENN